MWKLKLQENDYISIYVMTTSGYTKALLMHFNHAGVPIKMPCALHMGGLDASNLKAQTCIYKYPVGII